MSYADKTELLAQYHDAIIFPPRWDVRANTWIKVAKTRDGLFIATANVIEDNKDGTAKVGVYSAFELYVGETFTLDSLEAPTPPKETFAERVFSYFLPNVSRRERRLYYTKNSDEVEITIPEHELFPDSYRIPQFLDLSPHENIIEAASDYVEAAEKDFNLFKLYFDTSIEEFLTLDQEAQLGFLSEVRKIEQIRQKYLNKKYDFLHEGLEEPKITRAELKEKLQAKKREIEQLYETYKNDKNSEAAIKDINNQYKKLIAMIDEQINAFSEFPQHTLKEYQDAYDRSMIPDVHRHINKDVKAQEPKKIKETNETPDEVLKIPQRQKDPSEASMNDVLALLKAKENAKAAKKKAEEEAARKKVEEEAAKKKAAAEEEAKKKDDKKLFHLFTSQKAIQEEPKPESKQKQIAVRIMDDKGEIIAAIQATISQVVFDDFKKAAKNGVVYNSSIAGGLPYKIEMPEGGNKFDVKLDESRENITDEEKMLAMLDVINVVAMNSKTINIYSPEPLLVAVGLQYATYLTTQGKTWEGGIKISMKETDIPKETMEKAQKFVGAYVKSFTVANKLESETVFSTMKTCGQEAEKDVPEVKNTNGLVR